MVIQKKLLMESLKMAMPGIETGNSTLPKSVLPIEVCSLITIFELVESIDFNNPSYDDIVAIAEDNHFLFSDDETKGEGVVCKAQGWKNKYGHTCYGKIVLAEFHEHKKKGKHKANLQAENIEKEIVRHEEYQSFLRRKLFSEYMPMLHIEQRKIFLILHLFMN